MSQFGRAYKVTIGNPLALTGADFSPLTDNVKRFRAIEDYVGSAATNAVVLDQLNASFSIERTGGDPSQQSVDTATVSLYNLSDSTVKMLEIYNGQFPTISIEIGYVGALKPLFKGVVESYKDRFEGETRVTELKLSDGGQQIRQAQTARSYPKGTKVDQIVSDLLGDIGLPKASEGVVDIGDDVATTKTVYFNGRTSEGLWRMGRNYDTTFTIQNMTTVSVPKGKFIYANGVEAISEENGLIGSVVAEDSTDGAAESSTGTPTLPSKVTVRFKTLLDAELLPNYAVAINSRNYKGVFKLLTVRHSGTFEGNDWYSECTAERVE